MGDVTPLARSAEISYEKIAKGPIEASAKLGVAPADARMLVRAIALLPGLRLRGLMTIPEPTGDVSLQRRRFESEMAAFGLNFCHGLGLGLFISQQIALAHGGSVGVDSNERVGTVFCVRIPHRSTLADTQGPLDGE